MRGVDGARGACGEGATASTVPG